MTVLSKHLSPVEMGRRLRERRTKLGLSQGQIAHRAHISAPYISNVELGKTSLHVETIRRVILNAELVDRRWRREVKRVNSLRGLFSALPKSPEKDALEIAMAARAWEFLELGRAKEADAILEFVPTADAMLDSFFREKP